MGSDDNLSNLRVASFSYYLKSNDQENFVQKLMSLPQNPPMESTLKVKQLSPYNLNDLQENSPNMVANSPQKHGERNKSMDGEIDIFGADKYFNMEYPAREKLPRDKKNDDPTVDVDGEINIANLRQVTPSVCSEASTWSSGVALLQNLPRITSQKRPKRTPGRRFLSSIGCTGPCFDKESVYVNRNSQAPRNELNTCKVYRSAGSNIGQNFTFPLGVAKPSLKLNLTQLENQKLEELRKSIEVFGSDTMKKDEITKNLERRLSMLTWDAIPKSSHLPTTSVVSTTVCDDMASDVSSDLFEIENISASCVGYALTRDSVVDDVPNCMASPTTQYAPSEASFEWSVMTASAIDFSSAMSDYDPKNFSIPYDAVVSNSKNSTTTKEAPKSQSNSKNSITTKDAPKSRSGGLLGCKSLRSVSVAETVHKTKVERY